MAEMFTKTTCSASTATQPPCECTSDVVCDGLREFMLSVRDASRVAMLRGRHEASKNLNDMSWEVFHEHRTEAIAVKLKKRGGSK